MGRLTDTNEKDEIAQDLNGSEDSQDMIVEEDEDCAEALEYVQQLINRMNPNDSGTKTTPTAQPTPSSPPKTEPSPKTAQSQPAAQAVLPDENLEITEETPVKKREVTKPKAVHSYDDIMRLREAANLTTKDALQTFGSKQLMGRAYVTLFLSLFFVGTSIVSRLVGAESKFAFIVSVGSLGIAGISALMYFRILQLIVKTETNAHP